eukprot:TRINITY_DN63764_c0_g1_i1.p1 TRINITY_DN63764_c0_g1~~TRINITY_DN63764_c0_g1_i1.p1  ORF type:complete len:351 (+),score=61.91 TRINITY_DN63764_c0_g1_i1:137-1054(+)
MMPGAPPGRSNSFVPPVGGPSGAATPTVPGAPLGLLPGGISATAAASAAGLGSAPPSLTQGIPDPGAIARQKDVYLKMLDDQLKQGINVLDQQVKYQRDYLSVQCEQQKKQFLLQLDQQMKAQEMVLTQQYNEQLMALQMQAGTQKAALEQQAMQLSMEYEQRKAEEHMYRQQYEIQQHQTEMAVKLARDYQRVVPSGLPSGAATPAEPPAASYSPVPGSPMPGSRDLGTLVGGAYAAWGGSAAYPAAAPPLSPTLGPLSAGPVAAPTYLPPGATVYPAGAISGVSVPGTAYAAPAPYPSTMLVR